VLPVSRWRSIGDRTVVFGQSQIFRQPPHRLEVAIPHHGLLARPDDGGQVGQLHRSQCRHANPQVDQAVGSITIGGVERSQQPGGMRIRGEQAHHGLRISVLPGGAGVAVGQQVRALVGGDERGQAVRPQTCGTAEALSRIPTKAPMRNPTYTQRRRSTKAHARKSGKTRIRLSAFEESRQCGFQQGFKHTNAKNEHYRL